MLISQERFEEAQEKAFEELDYEECTEDQCIMMIQEMLQVENVFHLEVIGEGSDTQLSLSWRTLDEKKKETDYCEGCKTKELNEKVDGLVDKLVGVKTVETKVVEFQKDVRKKIKESVVQEIEEVNTEGIFVSVGQSGTILTSPNGKDWTKRPTGSKQYLRGISYGNNIFVSIGESEIITSQDGINWVQTTQKYYGKNESLMSITYGKGIFVAVGRRWDKNDLNGITLFSNDGFEWKKTYDLTDYLRGITYGDGIFVSVGSGGTILTSNNGYSWTNKPSGTEKMLQDVIYRNGVYISVGRGGTIISSSNGTSWNQTPWSNSKKSLNGITYGNGLFVTVGSSGTILTSYDGNYWDQRNSGTNKTLKRVVYYNGIFITVGFSGTILTSSNGIDWVQRHYSKNLELSDISYSK